MLTMTNAIHGTPTEALHILSQIFPLDLFVERESLLKVTNMKYNRQWDGHSSTGRLVGHMHCHEKQLKSIGLALGNPGVERNPATLRVDIQDGKEAQERPEEIQVYTDGSKTKDGVGSGVVVNNRGNFYRYRCKLPDYSTVYEAEVNALLRAALFLLALTLSGENIHFYCDSQAALKLLQNMTIRSKLVRDTVQALTRLGESKNVILHWVRAHVGTKGNEEADRLAKAGTTFHSEIFIDPGRSYTKLVLKRRLVTAWDQRYQSGKYAANKKKMRQ